MLEKILSCLILYITLLETQAEDYQGQDAYLGCFVDHRLARDLNKLPGQMGNVWIGSNSNMTIEACLNLCRSFSLPFAGLEFSNECYCGDSYGRYGRVLDTQCNMKCNGNSNQVCGGLDRISIYSVRILVRSELIIVLNGSATGDSIPVRLAQSITTNSVSFIDYYKSSGQIKVYANNNMNPIVANALRSDLPNNQYYIFLSLRGNQLATFYNCYISDALMLNDSTVTNTFLSVNTEPVKGQVYFNKNLNEVFQMYGCINYQDGYQQIFSQTNNLVKGYCKLTLNDLQNVNYQMNQIIKNITSERATIENLVNVVGNNLQYCARKNC